MTDELKDWTSIETPQDIRLVVADMDGTLLDADSELPLGFWPMLDRLEQRGIAFVPASGRQYQTLQQMFARAGRPMSVIAENGNVVAVDGEVVETHGVNHGIADETISMVDATSEDLGLVALDYSTHCESVRVSLELKYFSLEKDHFQKVCDSFALLC